MQAVNKIQLIHNSLLLLLFFGVASCKKEAPLQPDEKDENRLEVKDNPSDPVDHAIYQFYQTTGVPVFYNDTIERIHVGDTSGIPVYSYRRLATNYSPFGIQPGLSYKLIPEKEQALPLLPLLREEVLSRVPTNMQVYSILIVKSLTLRGISNADNSGFSGVSNKPHNAFNTILIPAVNPDTMTAAGKKTYAASVLAKLASKRLLREHLQQIQTEFYSLTKNVAPGKRIYGDLWSALSPGVPVIFEEYGFIRASYSLIMYGRKSMPMMQDDLLTYLEAALTYETIEAFDADYASYPVVRNKFRAARTLLRSIGFQIL
ncbi:hypothetical protein HHL16_22350 [Pseudoflavitalea sp. G-6-1-2]|uniref:hypothetical protein n=1 Tax=Pseudoflavitalea sp. G-6-1-2 TaxID=2728841 RepID=UPI00146B06F9|nr:hypothetical protein [Pseudoflavitalea sp. G-6-1-2]NML23638.1 hypothetical protein [Pseudoflavitalea sp. G-6-1-2]